MKKADEAVEKVLAGLRGVEAGSGFEERMVRRVRGAAGERGRAGWYGIWQWVAVGCVASLLVGVGANLWPRQRHGVVARSVGAGDDARRRAGMERGGEMEEGVPQRLKPRAGMGAYGTAKAVPLSRAGSSDRRASLRAMRAREEVGYVDLRGVGGGFPAPPLPLTAQERLLLRVARRGEPLPVVALEVAAVPSREAEETAEFLSFFGKPERVEQGNQIVNQGESR